SRERPGLLRMADGPFRLKDKLSGWLHPKRWLRPEHTVFWSRISCRTLDQEENEYEEFYYIPDFIERRCLLEWCIYLCSEQGRKQERSFCETCAQSRRNRPS